MSHQSDAVCLWVHISNGVGWCCSGGGLNVYCPGKAAAMVIIVASPSCTAYLWEL